ncbi:MAG: TRAP transporter large permease subunit [Rhodobacteraceae bacterium]|nr:TRAP transporter large permease subunit [Paracoccaceae bacterium]
MTSMHWSETSLIIVGAIFVLLAMGLPVAVALGLVGVAASFLFVGHPGIIAYVAWDLSNSFIMSAIPLFIFMGQVMLRSGVSSRLYSGSGALLGRTRGGLLQTNIVACGLFATVSGSSVATAATVGSMAIPEMERLRYDERLSLGSIAAGGTLGILIPPSSAFIIYGVIAEQSIGELFIAGILPGLLLMLMFMGYIWLRVVLSPGLAPPADVPAGRERIRLVLAMWPIFVVMFVVLAGIYLGIMTPSEAAAIGSLLSLIFAALFRRLTLPVLVDCLMSAVRTTSMLLFIMVGAGILGGTMGMLRIPESLAAWVLGLEVQPFAILLSIYLMYLVLGCFIDTVSMIVISVPFVLPVVTGLGYDPIWFGVVMVVLVEMALITPPVGLNVYTIQGLRPGKPIGDVFRGALPFLAVMVVALGMLTLFPAIATWLPATMR